jgi:hypothetical protein
MIVATKVNPPTAMQKGNDKVLEISEPIDWEFDRDGVRAKSGNLLGDYFCTCSVWGKSIIIYVLI